MTEALRWNSIAVPLVVLLVLTALMACAAPPTPTATPTPTVSPEDIYEVSEIHPTCQVNPAKCRVSIYIRDTVSGFHSDKDEFFMGATRDTADWATLRVHARAETISELAIGDQVFLRCDDLTEERSGLLGMSEYRCTAGQKLP